MCAGFFIVGMTDSRRRRKPHNVLPAHVEKTIMAEGAPLPYSCPMGRMYRLVTFGGLSLADASGSDVAIPRRRLAMLALLAAAGSRGLTRDKLVAYLWPDSSADDARHSLEQLLYSLRRQLGAGVFVGIDPLRLNADIISSDVAEFDDLVNRDADGDAVTMYRGPFLDGFYLKGADEFGRWVEDERSRLNAAYGASLERLADGAAARNDWGRAVAAWRSLVAMDRLSARNALGLIRALAAAGDRPEALRTASAYEALVQHELGIPLEPSITTFVRSLRNGNPVESDRRPDGETTRSDRTRDSPDRSPDVTRRPPLQPENTTTAVPRVARVRRPRPVALLALGVAALLSTIWLTSPMRFRAPGNTPDGRQRVLVTVFENRTGDTARDIVGIMTADFARIALDHTGLVDVDDPAFDFWKLDNARPENRANPSTLVRNTRATIIVGGAYYKEGDSLAFTGWGTDARSGRTIFERAVGVIVLRSKSARFSRMSGGTSR